MAVVEVGVGVVEEEEVVVVDGGVGDGGGEVAEAAAEVEMVEVVEEVDGGVEGRGVIIDIQEEEVVEVIRATAHGCIESVSMPGARGEADAWQWCCPARCIAMDLASMTVT